jgi:putative flippase GtrA
MPESVWKRLAKHQVVMFVLSAGTGFIADITCFFLLFHYVFTSPTYQMFGLSVGNYMLSLSISYFIGVVINFLMTRYLVFAQSKLDARKQFLRFALVAFVGFFANMGVLKLLIQYLQLYPPVARVVAALSLFIVSFFVHKIFSFKISLNHHARSHHKPGN